MAVTRTFSIIKPDATRRNLTGAVTAKLEEAGLRVVASKRIQMSQAQAEGFYAVHKERPFFGEDTLQPARECWVMLGKRGGVDRRFWKQQGGKWVEGP